MAAGVHESVSEWSYDRTLGSGGFGAVYLYYNKVLIDYFTFALQLTVSSISCILDVITNNRKTRFMVLSLV